MMYEQYSSGADEATIETLESELQNMRSELEQVSATITAERVKGRTEASTKVYEELSSGLEEVGKTLQAVRNAGDPVSNDMRKSLQSKMNAFRSQWVRDIQVLKSDLQK